MGPAYIVSYGNVEKFYFHVNVQCSTAHDRIEYLVDLICVGYHVTYEKEPQLWEHVTCAEQLLL